MFQLSRSTLLGLGIAVTLLTACQKQKEVDATPAGVTLNTPAGIQQVSTEELAARMAQDPLVREFVQANREFTGKHDAWVAGLSPAGKAARQHDLDQAHATGHGWDKLAAHFGTPAEEAQHHAAQEARVNQIKAKYGLSKLSSEERGHVFSLVTRLVSQQLKNTTTNREDPNAPGSDKYFDAYNDCSWSCYDNNGGQPCHNACKVGYNTCKG